ncbi:MAG TPA: glycosyltransferase family A protein [Vicinamibacterales bacterium]|nr:glycosyltransferase family A protein [Vicinamibacterales bacterium]
MPLSVVIATFNRAPLLRECLARFERQAFRPGDEVVVADNGSTDATPDVLREAAARLPVPLRTVFEAKPGKSRAVARGVEAARGDILAFTDDDVIVADDWIERLHAIFEERDVDLVGGRVLPRFMGRVPSWLKLSDGRGYNRMASPITLLDYGPERQPLGRRAAPGGNLAIRRSVFEALGGFPRHLGKLRGTLLSGEDHLLSERVVASGYRAIFEPSLTVQHLVPRSRLRFRYFLRWFFWSGVTHAVLDAGREPGEHARPLTRYHAGQGVKMLGKAALAALAGGWTGAAREATEAAFSAGYVWAGLSPRVRQWIAAGRGAEAA